MPGLFASVGVAEVAVADNNCAVDAGHPLTDTLNHIVHLRGRQR